MSTIVSALLTNINNHRNIDKYVEYGKQLLSIPTNKIIFIEQPIFDTYFKEYQNETTIFHFIEKKELYLYEYHNDMTQFKIQTINPGKDTIEYMFVQCNKTEWMKQAIELDPFHTDSFIWLDFGIYHIFEKQFSPKEFQQKILDMVSNNTHENKVRIGSIINPYYNKPIDNAHIYTRIQWFFAGGVFGGTRESLIDFANLTKQKCLQIIKDRQTLMWEVNIWYVVFLENPTLFSLYKCDHNKTIVDNYVVEAL